MLVKTKRDEAGFEVFICTVKSTSNSYYEVAVVPETGSSDHRRSCSLSIDSFYCSAPLPRLGNLHLHNLPACYARCYRCEMLMAEEVTGFKGQVSP